MNIIEAMKQALEALNKACDDETPMQVFATASTNLRAAIAEAEKCEPDCWAVLTPNGSKLVSPAEAKGLLKAYPLYTHPLVKRGN